MRPTFSPRSDSKPIFSPRTPVLKIPDFRMPLIKETSFSLTQYDKKLNLISSSINKAFLACIQDELLKAMKRNNSISENDLIERAKEIFIEILKADQKWFFENLVSENEILTRNTNEYSQKILELEKTIEINQILYVEKEKNYMNNLEERKLIEKKIDLINQQLEMNKIEKEKKEKDFEKIKEKIKKNKKKCKFSKEKPQVHQNISDKETYNEPTSFALVQEKNRFIKEMEENHFQEILSLKRENQRLQILLENNNEKFKFFSSSKKLFTDNNYEIEQITPRIEQTEIIQLKSMENSKIKEKNLRKDEKIFYHTEKRLSSREQEHESNQLKKKLASLLKLIEKLKLNQKEIKENLEKARSKIWLDARTQFNEIISKVQRNMNERMKIELEEKKNDQLEEYRKIQNDLEEKYENLAKEMKFDFEEKNNKNEERISLYKKIADEKVKSVDEKIKIIEELKHNAILTEQFAHKNKNEDETNKRQILELRKKNEEKLISYEKEILNLRKSLEELNANTKILIEKKVSEYLKQTITEKEYILENQQAKQYEMESQEYIFKMELQEQEIKSLKLDIENKSRALENLNEELKTLRKK